MIDKLPRENHGQRNHPLYDTWLQMRYRCTRTNHHAYPRYGGRGISYDQRWNKFSAFLQDVESSWKEGLSLDRIDNNSNYCKENCRWATPIEQSNNRKNMRLVEFNGKSQTLTNWAKELGMKKSTLKQRFYSYKWPIERVLNTN
jgi:hypothetical protein